MDSIFEENEEQNPIKGGTWKTANEDTEELNQLLNAPSLLEEPRNEGKVYLLDQNGNFQKYYGIIYNELFYIVKNKHDQINILHWINLKFRRIQKVVHESKPGFKIIGNKQFVQVFFSSNKHFEIWHQFFSEFCIQLNLEEVYKKEKQVGKGNYAIVYLGKEIETDEIIAIKSVFKTTVRQSHRSIQAIIQEIESMRGLHHNNLMGLFAVYEDEENVHMIVEFCAGGELFKRILKRGKYTEYNAAKFAQNCLSSFVYMHEVAHVCHRDLKPENIMMSTYDNDYDFKITDFGLASKFDPQNPDLRLRCGSPGYVAPEILKDQPYGSKVDIFSLGIIVYILLVGRQPFYGKNPQEVLIQNRDCKINFQAKYWQEISKEAMHFVISLTDPDPKTRPSAREALEHKWFKNICSSQQDLLPANVLETPNLHKIQMLSPGLTPESKMIPREKLARNIGKMGEDGKVKWSEVVNSPAPPVEKKTFEQKVELSKSDKLQMRPINREKVGVVSQVANTPTKKSSLGKKITASLLQGERKQINEKVESNHNKPKVQLGKQFQSQRQRSESPKSGVKTQNKVQKIDKITLYTQKRENKHS